MLESQSWSYLVARPSQTPTVRHLLEERFNTYAPMGLTARSLSGEGSHTVQVDHPGLLFVQGRCADIQQCLTQAFGNVYLARNHATGRIATIPDRAMRSFMRVTQVAPRCVRILPHPFAYYEEGNKLIRMTSGIGQGIEGYRIRIARDRCLVTNVGGLGVAIGGIHHDSYVEV